ncbi:MAG: glycosyltransferase [Candidatus Omnitrophica bacterium]|nr:glycosyltransferase [Candidatus Omnitrophota bacterium]
MKIIQTPVRFPPYIGGTEKVTYYLSKELMKKGHEVKVICADEPAVGSGRIDGIDVLRLPFVGKVANSNITLALFNQLMKENFDIMHTHLPHPWAADISAVVSKIKKKPLFLTYYNDIVGEGINKIVANMYNSIPLRFLLRQARKIFIINDNYIESSPFLKGFSNKVLVTHLGVDIEKYKPIKSARNSQGNNSIFFLSRLDKFHRYKGLEYLFLSVKKLLEKFPVKLYVGGAGELLDYYKDLARHNGIEIAVDFLGCLTDTQIVEYYNSCDVFVLPSISSAQEGFGMVALEAMACQKAVIVTEVVGVAAEVEKNSAGIIVESRDVDSLSNALERILSDKRLAREMGENAYRVATAKYTWKNYADAINREYLTIKQ